MTSTHDQLTAPQRGDAASDAPTKALILARGLGTRMRATSSANDDLSAEQKAVAAQGLKAMMPLGVASASSDGATDAAHPFIAYVINALADAGITDVALVIGPEHEAVRAWCAELAVSRLRVTCVEQAEPLGTADAVAAGRAWAGQDRFLMLNSDNYYPQEALRALRQAPGTALLGFDPAALVAHSNIPAERIAAFALVESDASGNLRAITEKPTSEQRAALGSQARVSMNCFSFGPSIFDACARTEISVRGEYEIVDAVRLLLAAGEDVAVVPVAQGVLDMSGRGDIAAVAEALAGQRLSL